MALVLALASALAYGTADYVGGRASRKLSPLNITLVGDTIAGVLILIAVPLIEDSPPDNPRMWWGLLAGVCGAVGVIGLYRALASGAMTIAAPVTGLVAAALPVVVGFALGDRPGPLAVLGIVLAVIAIVLIGGLVGAVHQPLSPQLLVLAIVVGLAFGMLFVAYALAGRDTGLWSLATARIAAFPVLVGAYLARRRHGHPPIDRATVGPALVVGVLIALANGLYLLSTQNGMLAIVAVVVSLYPAATIGLAVVLDHERVSHWQGMGMMVAVVAVSLIALA